uniref:Mce/MlaD domain-containing protein n=1 Tax=Crouania attenuata TaxID=42002 RepID=A0A4D6WQM2_9FLOR|nr:hypothetical protein [Crouania attenuata]
MNFRGINIGYVKNIETTINNVITLIHIKSSNIKIPRYSIIEINQTGLFNDTSIDIIPLEKLLDSDKINIDIFSKDCVDSSIFCHHHYIKGNRGLNYDDLIRATTRIAQRFDDPRFFKFFYILLQSSLDITDEILLVTHSIHNSFLLLYSSISIFLFRYK